MENKMENLKRCPFCDGGKLDVYSYDPFDGYMGDNTLHCIRCRYCGANIKENKMPVLVEKWNRRATDEKAD